MDPQLRKLLEVAFEAWVDSGARGHAGEAQQLPRQQIADSQALPWPATGIDFHALRGSKRVGCYVGACGTEAHGVWLADMPAISGYEQTGCSMSMFANRLSWWFDFRGPSKCVDTGAAWCSACFGSILFLA
jgi:fatty acid synthase